MSAEIQKLIKKYRLESLLDGAKCPKEPLSKYNAEFSPKSIVKAIAAGDGEVFPDALWESVECAMEPVEKSDFAGFVREVRAIACEGGFSDVPVYGGVMRTISRMLTKKSTTQNRLSWVTNDMAVSKRGDVVLFIGDLPYYEEIFASELRYHPLDTARNAVRLLNAAGIKPVVMNDEVSSGHDELWSGDVETFEKLAERNIKAIGRTGAKTVITLDAESHFMLKKEYPARFKGFKVKVAHITEVLAGHMKKLVFGKSAEKTAYHDPCKFGKALGITDAPRKVLSALLEGKIVKTKHEGSETRCAGAHRLSNCGSYAKQMQLDVLREAEKAGAEVLVSGCPREALVLKMALKSESWKQTNIEVMELISLAGDLYRRESA